MILVEAAQHMIVSKHVPKEESLLSWDSNRRPLENQSDALTTSPWSARYYPEYFQFMICITPPTLADIVEKNKETLRL